VRDPEEQAQTSHPGRTSWSVVSTYLLLWWVVEGRWCLATALTWLVSIDGLSNIEVLGDVCASRDWLRVLPLPLRICLVSVSSWCCNASCVECRVVLLQLRVCFQIMAQQLLSFKAGKCDGDVRNMPISLRGFRLLTHSSLTPRLQRSSQSRLLVTCIYMPRMVCDFCNN